MNISPRFAALTLEKGKQLPNILVDGKPQKQRQLKREMEAVNTIFEQWTVARKAEIDKITDGKNIKLKVMNLEEYDAAYTNKADRKRARTWGGTSMPSASFIGGKFYAVDEAGKETRLQIRWPGNNPDGPMSPRSFQSWAEDFITKPRNVFNALTKALKQGVANLGVENNLTYESES